MVDDHAPVRATASIIIDAAPVDVWKVLADIRRWPEWEHDIQTTTVSRIPAIDVPFQWSTSGGTIHSRIMLFEPSRRIAWIGNLLIFHAVHVWVLHARPDGRTAVETHESMTGWPIGWLYSSKDLLEADRRWLAALKKEVES
ncbi:MAG: SRPBCC family protein [Janthinobacterium lividum]